MQVFFDHRELLAPGIWQHYFRSERPVRFEPGQYVDLQLPLIGSDPRGATRTFTLTSLPKQPLLSFVTKDQPYRSLYKQVLAGLQPRTAATITDPMGDLVLPKDPATPVSFVAGGIGVSSFISMLHTLEYAQKPRQVQLYYAVRSSEEVIFADSIDSFAFEYHEVCIAPARLKPIQMVKKAPRGCIWYISGSQRFVETMRGSLLATGIDRQAIVFDYYDGYAEL